jgi:putative endonuclease
LPFIPPFVIARSGEPRRNEFHASFAIDSGRSNLLALTKGRGMFMRQFYIYIMTNKYHNVFYVGMTNDLVRRVYEHKEKLLDGFTKRYNLNKLVYYEVADTASAAIARERQLKGGSRENKIELIKQMNPRWLDLYETIL